MPSRTAALAQSPLFQDISVRLPHDERIHLTYKRAIAIGKVYKFTVDEIHNLTQKFWDFHMDPIIMMDGGAASLLILHLNLCSGTLARHAAGRRDIQYTLKKLLNFELFGQFCLTEQAHGLDARNLETTATLLPDGTIDLHTPTDGAAKHMPPTSPCGIPTMAVVFARFMVNGEDRGIKPFSVLLHDGYNMSKGITSKVLTPRGSSVPMNHCLTYFNHVFLPPTSLLSSAEKEGNDRSQFFDTTFRIIVGTISLSAFSLSSLKMGAYVAGRYSQRRKVTDAFTGTLTPIISFPTQQYPVLAAISQSIVFDSFLKQSIAWFTDHKKHLSVRHCIAAITKATLVKHSCALVTVLGDRCGAQGVFEVNQFTVQYADIRGASIAEGDILAISVRFGVELVIGRIILPTTTNPDSLLARRVASMFTELQHALKTRFKHHRDPGFQEFVLPQCQSLIEAIGFSMAYDAAVSDGVDQTILDMFVSSVIKEDRAWFSEVAGISRAQQMDMERAAMQALIPRLDELLEELDVTEYCTAPIISDEKWKKYVRTLPTFTSNADTPYGTSSLKQSHLVRAML